MNIKVQYQRSYMQLHLIKINLWEQHAYNNNIHPNEMLGIIDLR